MDARPWTSFQPVVNSSRKPNDSVSLGFTPNHIFGIQSAEPGAPAERRRCWLPRHLASWKGKPIELTATEFKLLTILAQRAGRVQSRDSLLRDVWEYDSLIDTRTVDTHMRRLREKLGAASKHLDTVRGVGYRFVE